MASSAAMAALAGLAFFQGAEAYWRMPCGVIQTGRIDPLINPGTVSGHVHKLAGPPSIGPNSTYDSLQDNRCTSCQVQADKSAYWTPVLYYRHGNGSFEEVPAGGMTVYYLGRGENAANIQPFPKGFRMLSGEPQLRSFDNSTYTFGGKNGVIYTDGHCRTGDMTCTGGTYVNHTGTKSDPPGPVFTGRPVADRVSFNCINYDDEQPETYYMNNTNCPDGLRAQIQFPSCWNGVDLYKSDQSHVDYLSQIDNGVCSPDYPILLPHLFFEVLYFTSDISEDANGEYVWAYGDASGGYGFHGDFLNGWDEDVLQQAIDQCVNVDNGGDLAECEPFLPTLDFNSGYNCPEQPPLFDEAVHGMIGTKLPGCITVTDGPDSAPLDTYICPANTTSPVMNTTYQYGGGSQATVPAVGTVLNNFSYIGCFNDDSPHSFSQASLTSALMTIEVCQSFCTSKNMPLAGLEYGTQCYCGYQFNATINYAKDCNSMICSGNGSEYCGSGSTLSTWNSTIYTGSYDPTLPDPGAVIDGGFQYLGCANEATNARALKNASLTSSTNMTNDLCASFCASKNLPLFATEYSQECYCGSALGGDSVLGQTGCNMGCKGTVTSGPFAGFANTCGGSSRLTVWNNTKIWIANAAPSSSVVLSSATSSKIVLTSSVSSASPINVISTSAVLSRVISVSSLTTSLMSSDLASKSSSTSKSSASPSSTSLTYPTPSSIIANSPYVYLGCASEATSGRALNVSSTTSSTNMTADFCASYCASKSLPLFGVEYGSQCYCGNTLAPGSLLSQTGCTKLCSGLPLDPLSSSPFASVPNICGGSSRLNVYNNTAIPAVSNVQNFTLSGAQWTYKGCFKDASGPRVLSNASYSSGSGVNVTTCASYCQTKGFPVAGIEYAGECYCGAKMLGESLRADEWDCAMQCNGNAGLWCGAGSRLSVYEMST